MGFFRRPERMFAGRRKIRLVRLSDYRSPARPTLSELNYANAIVRCINY